MRLAEWSTHPIHIPYGRAVRWASTEEAGADYLLLRLVSDDGLVGVAEGVLKATWNGVTARSLPVVLEELFIPLIRDVDLLDEAAVARALARVPEHRLAKSMVDAACWDLRSQVAHKPLWQLWEGDAQVPVSWTVTRQEPRAMAGEAETMVSRHGFRTLKVKGGQGWERDFQALAEIRAACGPGVALYVDANGAYPADEALGYVRELAERGVFLAEDPCHLLPNAAFRDLQQASPIPLLVDHGCNNARDAALFLEQGARALSLKLSRAGPTECRRIAAVAHARGCGVHLGLGAESSLGALLGLQVASALPGRERSLPAELAFFLMLPEEYVTEPLRVQDGQIQLPATPGLACRVDWDRVRALHP
jgi:L-alanine-DL-glutamate epimerase-like enolase superfamily enzyme